MGGGVAQGQSACLSQEGCDKHLDMTIHQQDGLLQALRCLSGLKLLLAGVRASSADHPALPGLARYLFFTFKMSAPVDQPDACTLLNFAELRTGTSGPISVFSLCSP